MLVGRVAGAFGVRGEIRITAYTDDPQALVRYRALKREDGTPALTLQSGRPAKGRLIARAAEVSTKEEADALRGLHLYVPRDAFPEPEDDDEFYLADLIGLRAVSTAGEPLGTVKAVHNFGAGDILELDPGQGRPTSYLPFSVDAVPEVRLADGVIVCAPPEEIESEEE